MQLFLRYTTIITSLLTPTLYAILLLTIITLQLLPCNITFHHHVQYFSCAMLLLTTTSQYHCQLVLLTEYLFF